MPTPSERRALMFLSALLLLGVGFRAGSSLRAEPSTVALDRQLAAVDSARRQATSRRRTRAKAPRSAPPPPPSLPTGAGMAGGASAPPPIIYYARTPGEQPGGAPSVAARVDLDVATAAQIEQLPRIGPVLARRIVSDRDSLGPFGSLKELRRVKGVGPALARAVEPYVTFSLSPRPHGVVERGDRGSSRGTRGRSRRPRSK